MDVLLTMSLENVLNICGCFIKSDKEFYIVNV